MRGSTSETNSKKAGGFSFLSRIFGSNSAFARFFNSEKISQLWKSSFICSLFSKIQSYNGSFLKFKLKTAELSEKSPILRFFDFISKRVLSSNLTSLGIFGLFHGGIIISALITNRTSPLSALLMSNTFIYATLVLIISLIILPFRSKSLFSCIYNSKIASYVLFEVLSVNRIQIKTKPMNLSAEYMIFGLLSGILSYVVSPKLFIICVLALVVLSLILTKPENGIILAFMSIAFLGTYELLFIFASTILSHFSKLIRGKRPLNINVYSAIVLLMGLVFFVNSLSSFGTSAAKYALIVFNIIFFSVSVTMLVSSSALVGKCIKALCISGFISAFAVILSKYPAFSDVFSIYTPKAILSYIDKISDYRSMLVAISIAVLPVILAEYRKKKAFSAFVCILALVIALTASSSYSAIFALLLAFVIITAIVYYKISPFIIIITAAVYYFLKLLQIIPVFRLNFISKSNEIYNFVFSYLARFWFAGSGIGSNAVSNAAKYANQSGGTRDVSINGTLAYINMAVGIPLAAITVIFIVYLITKPLAYSLNNEPRLKCLSLVTSVLALIIYSHFTNYLLSLNSVMLFILVLLLGVMEAKNAKEEAITADYYRSIV
ncbi:MAG: hypothetical protein J5844_02565 [Clostridia bacterium]|nr:hypothetical protein [Clostridia bacterium]